MKFTLRAKSHRENRLWHYNTCTIYLFHWDADNLENTTKSDLARNIACSSTAALQFQPGSTLSKTTPARSLYLWQDKPNYDISATCNLSFFLKMGSRVKGGQVFYWWNHHGILLLFLFHQNATDQCLLQKWRHIHHTIGQSIMQPKCSLSPYFLHAYVRWTVWTGLYYTFKHKIRTCPSPVIPSGIKWHWQALHCGHMRFIWQRR